MTMSAMFDRAAGHPGTGIQSMLPRGKPTWNSDDTPSRSRRLESRPANTPVAARRWLVWVSRWATRSPTSSRTVSAVSQTAPNVWLFHSMLPSEAGKIPGPPVLTTNVPPSWTALLA